MQNPTEPALELAYCNCLAVRQAARRVSQFYDSYLAPLGLKTSQYSILAKLMRLGPMSINEIADSMVMDRTTTGRAIRPLERDRLVRIGNAEDGRKRVVSLTAAGRQARVRGAGCMAAGAGAVRIVVRPRGREKIARRDEGCGRGGTRGR